jgi:DNA-binding transcriptional ArsR family regulator
MAEVEVRTIADARALAAMANPQRSRIMDVLAVGGPSTASAIATRIDLAVGSASHHLKVLSEAGLVEQAPELARDRRERWWRLVAPSSRWSRTDFADDIGALTAAMAAETATLRQQFERAQDWLAGSGNPDDWDKAAFATQSWMSFSAEELDQFAAELLEFVQRWRYRDIPDDGAERRPVFVFTRGFPAQP